MVYTVSVTSKGQMTLPKKIRERFGIRTPDRVELDLDSRRNGFLKVRRVLDIMDFAGKFRVKKAINPVKIRAYMERHYERP